MENFLFGVTAATGLGGLAFALFRFRKSQSRITARLTYGPFVLPPQLLDFMKGIPTLIWEAENDRQLAAELRRCLDIESAAALLDVESQDVWTAMHRHERLTNLVSLTIKNSGKTRADEIAVSIPGAEWITVERDPDNSNLSAGSSVVEIGYLRPGEKAEVLAWTSSLFAPYRLDDVSITYNEGQGKVNVHEPVGPFLVNIYEFWEHAKVPLVLTVIVIALIIMTEIVSGGA